MDTQKLSVDKKEENNGAGQQGARVPTIPPARNSAANESIIPDQLLEIKPVGDALSEPEPQTPGKKRAFISAGERLDHWSKYLTVDWIWNASASAGFAYWGKYTEWGKYLWSNPVEKGMNVVLKPLFKNEANLKSGVGWGKDFMSIIMGGLMFTIPPLLVLESKKVKLGLIKFYDGLFYGKDKVESDPKFKQAYSEIENAPEKGFWANFWSRYIALAPLLASVIYQPSQDWLNKEVFTRVAGVTKGILSGVGMTPKRLFGKHGYDTMNERWEYINKNALGMDLTFGLPYAVMHAFWYNKLANVFAARKSKSEKEETAHALVNGNGTHAESDASSVITPSVVQNVALAPENGKKWTAHQPEKKIPAPHVIEKVRASDNFADKVEEKTGGERQVV